MSLSPLSQLSILINGLATASWWLTSHRQYLHVTYGLTATGLNL